VVVSRKRLAIGATFIAVIASGSAWAVARGDGARPRDESRFLSSVGEYFDGSYGRPSASDVQPLANDFIAEGDRACAWLADQPPPTGVKETAYASFRRYFREMPPPEGWQVGVGPVSGRGTLVYAAWDYLCDDVRRQQIWTPPPGDYD
jgi:hypothetical protein